MARLTHTNDIQPTIDKIKRLLRNGPLTDNLHDAKNRILRVDKLIDTEILLAMLHSYLFSDNIFGAAVWQLLRELYRARPADNDIDRIAFSMPRDFLNPTAMHYINLMARHGYLTYRPTESDNGPLHMVLTEKSLVVLGSWEELSEDALVRTG